MTSQFSLCSIDTINIGPNYDMSRTSVFNDKNRVLAKLNQTIVCIQRKLADAGYWEFRVLDKSLNGSIPRIQRITFDTKRERLLSIEIVNTGPLAVLGAAVVAEGYTPPIECSSILPQSVAESN